MTEYETKDSGTREEYDSGMVRDTQDGKPRFDLLVPEGVPYAEQFLTRVAALMARGAEKYGDRNWEKGNGSAELDRARASAFRHFTQWLAGDEDEDHAAAVVFNLLQAETLRYKMRPTLAEMADTSAKIGVSPDFVITGSPPAGSVINGQLIREVRDAARRGRI